MFAKTWAITIIPKKSLKVFFNFHILCKIHELITNIIWNMIRLSILAVLALIIIHSIFLIGFKSLILKPHLLENPIKGQSRSVKTVKLSRDPLMNSYERVHNTSKILPSYGKIQNLDYFKKFNYSAFQTRLKRLLKIFNFREALHYKSGMHSFYKHHISDGLIVVPDSIPLLAILTVVFWLVLFLFIIAVICGCI